MMRRRKMSRLLMAGRVSHIRSLSSRALFGCLLYAPVATAGVHSSTVSFNISEQPVLSALSEYARQADVQMAFVSKGFKNVQANALVGNFNRQEALDLLLKNTGLHAEFLADFTVMIRRSSADNTLETKMEPAIGENYALWFTWVEASLAHLQQDTRSAPRLQQTSERSTTLGTKSIDEPAKELSRVVVTGSRIRGPQNASPVITISRDDIDQAGFATVEEVFDKLPQNFSAGATLDTNADFINQGNVIGGRVDANAGGTSVNLRGLGASSTLILVNGHRLSPSGLSARFTNISSIPVTAIDRIEVLTDGASAVYGADAIAGVVNFILRDDYEGAETRLRYGAAQGDKPEISVGQTFGANWNDGNFLLSYEYFNADNLANGDRVVTSTNDLSQFGGTDWRVFGGNPANIRAGGQTFAIPAAQDGTSLTIDDFPVDANGVPIAPLNRHNGRLGRDIIPELERHSALLFFKQDIGKAELFAETRFSNQETQSRTSRGLIDIDVTDANPFFVDPTGTGLTTVRVENYSFENDLSPGKSVGEIDSFGAFLGASFDLNQNWSAEVVGNWFREDSTALSTSRLDLDALDAAVNPQNPGDPVFNPFGDGSSTNPNPNPNIFESLLDRTKEVISESENELWSAGLNVNGEVVDLPGGALQVATGIEFRRESLVSTRDLGTEPFTSDLNRDVTAVYAEVFLPLMPRSENRPQRRFELSLAARYEDYSDFGDTINPKVGVVWSPAPPVALHGTYGTSFRAPALVDLDVSLPGANNAIYFPEVPFVNPLGLIPFPFIVRTGGNENLQPEEATTRTAGVRWNPRSANKFSVDVTYFNIDFEDRIDLPGVGVTTVGDSRFASLLTRDPTLQQIAEVVDDPRFSEMFGVPASDLLSGAAPVAAIVDARKTNLAQTVVSGVDLELAHNFETTFGSFNVALNGNYLFDFERRLLAADPLVDEVDTLGRPVDFRARGSVTWVRGSWGVSGFVNYMDNYTDDISDPPRAIDSWVTVDLTIGFSTRDETGFLRNSRFLLSIRNLFDEDPPFVDTVGGLGYDTVNASPIGRSLALQINKEW